MSEEQHSLSGWELEQWQRMSPWSILYFIGSTLRNLLDPNVLVMLAPAYGLYQWMDNTFYFVLIAALAVPGLIIGAAVFQYLFFFFRVVDNNFQIRRGLLFKRHLDLPVSRIQDVNIDKPFYFKPVNLVSASLDTAGSSENEAVLAAVSLAFANDLREWVITGEKDTSAGRQESERPDALSGDTEDTPPATKAAGKAFPVLNRSLRDLVIHGITNNKVWIILAAAFPFLDRFLEHQWQSLFADQASEFSSLLQANALYAYGVVAGLVVALILVMMVLSVLGSILMLYGYEIHQKADALSRESGLFSRNQINLKIRRVQYIHIKQSLPDRLFRRFNLIYRQLDSNQPANRQSNAAFMVPSVTVTDISRLIALVYPESRFLPGSSDPNLKRISRRYIVQQFLIKTLPAVILILAFMVINDAQSYAPATGALLFTTGAIINVLQWYRWGYDAQEDFLILRMGILGKNYLLVPRYKIQQMSLSQSYPMSRNHHCHVAFVVGLSGLKIPYIPCSAGTQLIDQSLYDVESTSRSWM